MANREEIYILAGGYDKDGNFLGVSSKDVHILGQIRHRGGPDVVFRVTATSQKALPNESEMNCISHECPRLVFPLSIKFGMGEVSEKVFDLHGFTRGKMASVVYVDPDTVLHWAGREIDMKGMKAIKIEVEGTEIVHTVYFFPEPEVVEQGS